MKHVDATVGGKEFARNLVVRLRSSQIKFASNDLSLNVVRCATFSQGYLNRQLIILLSCMGVPNEVFLELQRGAKHLTEVNKIYRKLIEKTKDVY